MWQNQWRKLWRNTPQRYGLVSILLHWLVAIAVIGLFFLGLWMVDLSYYDPWYNRAPAVHKSIGVLLFFTVLLRLLWRYHNPTPQPLGKPWERLAAHSAHGLLYGLLILLAVSGYLISTADGRAIWVFDWFALPATVQDLPQQEDTAGDIHRWLAYGMMGLVVLHVLAALKHHFWDRDDTLRRILRVSRSTNGAAGATTPGNTAEGDTAGKPAAAKTIEEGD